MPAAAQPRLSHELRRSGSVEWFMTANSAWAALARPSKAGAATRSPMAVGSPPLLVTFRYGSTFTRRWIGPVLCHRRDLTSHALLSGGAATTRLLAANSESRRRTPSVGVRSACPPLGSEPQRLANPHVGPAVLFPQHIARGVIVALGRQPRADALKRPGSTQAESSRSDSRADDRRSP
jgi:hypothetical protein